LTAISSSPNSFAFCTIIHISALWYVMPSNVNGDSYHCDMKPLGVCGRQKKTERSDSYALAGASSCGIFDLALDFGAERVDVDFLTPASVLSLLCMGLSLLDLLGAISTANRALYAPD
jgi:hypothetical protein